MLGQCTKALENKLQSHKKFAAALNKGIELLKIIREVTCLFEETAQPWDAVDELQNKFILF